MRLAAIVFGIITCLFGSYAAIAQTVPAADTSHPNEARPKPVNILWVYIEDQNSWNNAYGDSTMSTPTIAGFASTGVRFDNAFMPAPVCSATRSALITGAWQTTNNVHNHRSSRSDAAAIYLPEGYKTVPELFREAGYATFNIGKDDYNFKYDRATLYSEHPGPKEGWQGALDGPEFNWAKELKHTPFFGQVQLQGGKAHTTERNDFNKADPQAMKLPPYYPDTPAFRKAWAQHYDTQKVSDLDLEKILGQLKRNDLLENTAVFFFADHGMKLIRHKQFLYEGGVRVPLIVNWPAGNQFVRENGPVRSDLVSGLDISATSLALAGIAIPSYYDGQDLFASNFRGRDYVISAKDRMDYTFDRSRAVRTKNYRYIRNFNPERPQLQAQYRDRDESVKDLKRLAKEGKLNAAQKLFVEPVKPVEELYDLRTDPHQIHNLADDKGHQTELLRHRQILLDWIARTDDKGAYPESDAAVREVIDMWGAACVSPECQSYRKRYGI